MPQLKDWTLADPLRVIEYHGKWVDIIDVCAYFLNDHEFNKYYIRELPVRAHTKYIEANRNPFITLLDFLLSPEKIRGEYSGARNFEKRYGLRYNEPQIRLRILDQGIADRFFSGVSDFSVGESDFAGLRLPLRNVIIMENKTNYSNVLNFLSLPHLRETIALFGSGFRVWLLKRAAWLKEINIYYWGDIDVQGLQILSQLRGYHPDVRAVLMDLETLNAFREYWDEGTETLAAVPENLNAEEKQLYSFLKENNIRLEQEKIRNEFAVQSFERVIV